MDMPLMPDFLRKSSAIERIAASSDFVGGVRRPLVAAAETKAEGHTANAEARPRRRTKTRRFMRDGLEGKCRGFTLHLQLCDPPAHFLDVLPAVKRADAEI